MIPRYLRNKWRCIKLGEDMGSGSQIQRTHCISSFGNMRQEFPLLGGRTWEWIDSFAGKCPRPYSSITDTGWNSVD
jgi:hypothetical protein